MTMSRRLNVDPVLRVWECACPYIVISPFAKTNYISHQQMDFVSILRFIQWNWNLGEIPCPAAGTGCPRAAERRSLRSADLSMRSAVHNSGPVIAEGKSTPVFT